MRQADLTETRRAWADYSASANLLVLLMTSIVQ